jgi:hypothetical protein
MRQQQIVFLSVLLAVAVTLGCSQRNLGLKPWPGRPRVAAFPETTGLVCWYVEDDGSGHHGYACVDDGLSVPRPDGNGLFSCLQDLRSELLRKNLNRLSMIPRYGGRTPAGWKIRALTQAELEFLQAPDPRPKVPESDRP